MSTELAAAADYIDWMKLKADLDKQAESAKGRKVMRGQAYWCHFGLNVGSETSKLDPRPAIIVQNYEGGVRSPNTIVVPVTHTGCNIPSVVPLTPVRNEDGKVLLNGHADTTRVMCVSKARLGSMIATVSDADMKKIDKGIAISLSLIQYYKYLNRQFEKKLEYLETVKKQRNAAQDIVKAARAMVAEHGFDETCQKKLKKLLDIK